MKVIRKDEVSAEKQASLINEIGILRQLDHPNIVKIYEFYQDVQSFYIITELIPGGELFSKLAKRKTFTEYDAANILRQIFSAVVYCHKRSIVHRDLKPENILFNTVDSDKIKVIDFGTSKIFDIHSKMDQKFGTVI